MVRKQDEIQTGSVQNAEKKQGGQQKPEQQLRNRVNHQGYNQSQRGQNQSYHQSGGQAAGVQIINHKDNTGNNQNQSGQSGQVANQGHNQSQTRNNLQGLKNPAERHEGHPREGVQNRGYYREKNRDNDRENIRQYAGAASPGGKYGNILRNRAEETIDDIKEDITRLEKEIELEIKEIKSLKL
jgi:hypothetical protein